MSTFASLADPTSRAYDDRKRAQSKRRNAALICLARRRVDVIYAMLCDRLTYKIPTSRQAPHHPRCRLTARRDRDFAFEPRGPPPRAMTAIAQLADHRSAVQRQS
jgi:hypothetical protein